MELTSVKNLPLKSWRQRRWFLLSAISMFPMLQWKTDPIHFLPITLDIPHAAMGNRACTFPPQVVIREPIKSEPRRIFKAAWPRSTVAKHAHSLGCHVQDVNSDKNMPMMVDYYVTRSELYTLVGTCDRRLINSHLSMPRSVITKLPLSPLAKNLDNHL